MKKLIFLMLIFLFVSPNEIFAEKYFVSQQASGDGSGSSYENCASIETHNSGTGNFKNLDNDIIVLTGKISEAIIVPDSGSDGNVVTYDGNAEAYDSQASNVTFTNWTKNASYSSFFVFNKSFITIKNIKIDWNYTSEMGSTPDNIYGIKIQDASNVIIESVDISQTHNGIGIFDNSYKVKVIKSKIYTIAESGIYITKYYSSFYPHDITIGGNKENGNLIKNCTYKTKWDNNNVGYDIRLSPDVENIIISHNHLYADKQGYGMSGILVHSSKNILIEYNTIHGHKCYMHRHGISIKGEVVSQVASNIVIRYNKIFDEQSDNNAYAEYSGGMMFSGNWENIYIYGNYIFSSGGGINVNYALWTSPATHSDGVDPKNINIWGNIISDTSHWGILIAGSSVGKDTIRQIAVLNNTLYRVAISADNQNWAAVSNVLNDQQTDNLLIKNNIIIDSRVNTNDKFAIFASKTNDTFIENNTAYIIDSIDSNIENIDKIFSIINNGIFSINPESDCIDSGVEIIGPTNIPKEVISLSGEFNYSYILDPTKTDWTTISPTVKLLKQSDYGKGWEKGAYVFVDETQLEAPRNITAVLLEQ